ncbi:MAG: hypothetical protein EPO36_14115 [Chloroflexota bacterium]|nr:MAG: hypothetical protein EPO36_14115 [Chloroflexota bacterium]
MSEPRRRPIPARRPGTSVPGAGRNVQDGDGATAIARRGTPGGAGSRDPRSATVPTVGPAVRGPRSPANPAEDRRLATLHLRLGGLALALAELEDLLRRGELDAPGLADLAEARWRTGALDRAAVAALEHIAAGGSRPIARVIAAEAAAATGRPVEARSHVEALGTVDSEALEHLFAGMPRRAFWPSAPSALIGPAATMFDPERAGPAGRRAAMVRHEAAQADVDPAAVPTRAGGSQPEMAGLWGDDESGLGLRPAIAARRPEGPAEGLARARHELATGDPAEHERGLARLALVLRQDPATAADVLAVVGPHREATAQLVRGDACRLLGRHLEAEAAFAAAVQALDDSRHRPRSRPS